ncbi:MAG: hypothetical protein CL933_12410 [Deltaproteobacteria bacterium]|nr:hypothetical protein [Deltaproteobacteria bacterium]
MTAAVLRTVLVLTFTLAAPAFAITPEDGGNGGGIEAEAALSLADQQRGWTAGKIDPAAEAIAAAGGLVDVMIHVGPGPGGAEPADGAAAVAAAKSAHRPQIEVSSKRLRELGNRSRPPQSLNEQQERAAVAAMRALVIPQDEVEMDKLRAEIDSARDDLRKAVGSATRVDREASKAAIAQLVLRLGGVVRDETLQSGVAASVPATALTDLAADPLVVRILFDPQTDYELNISVPSAQYDAWWNDANVYDGGLFDFGVVDSGVQQNHPAFAGVASFYTNSGSTVDSDSTQGHGTHVTGIVASSNATYRGGAYGLDAIIWAQSDGTQTTTMSNMDYLVTGAVQSPEVVNHSLGYGASAGVYSPNDSFYDAFVDNFDVMVTKSAGNSGWGASTTITWPGTAYNLMTVANMDDLNTTDRTDDVRRSSSSTGPVSSSRRKPDITAPGTNILSANSTWTTETDFVSKSGTSMAAPHVAAAIILMEDGGNNNPVAQKAVLINTADAWTSNNTEVDTDDGPVSGSFWDKSYGWGYLDMWEAHYNRADYFTGSVIGRDDAPDDDDYKLYSGTMFNNEKATLVWQKRATTYVPGAPSTDQHTLTDLNLRLYDETDGALIDSDLTGSDNVQQVASNATIDGLIKVYAWSTSIAGLSSEPYVLATEENFSAVSPPSFTWSYSTPVWVGPSQDFNSTVTVFNTGGAASHNTNTTLTNVAGIIGGATVNYGTLPAASNSAQVWSLTTSGAAAGPLVLPLSISSASYGEVYTYASTLSVNVETTIPISDCTLSQIYTNSTPVPIPWTASDTQTGVNRTDLYALSPGGASYIYTGLSSVGTGGTNNLGLGTQGQWDFAMSSVDVGGNWEGIPASSECSVFFDSVTPVASVSTPANVAGADIPLTFSYTDTAPASPLSSVDLWVRKVPEVVWTYTGLSAFSANGVINYAPLGGDGTYEFMATGGDAAGNADTSGAAESTTVYVPEPTQPLLLITGVSGLAGLARRRNPGPHA